MLFETSVYVPVVISYEYVRIAYFFSFFSCGEAGSSAAKDFPARPLFFSIFKTSESVPGIFRYSIRTCGTSILLGGTNMLQSKFIMRSYPVISRFFYMLVCALNVEMLICVLVALFCYD